MAQNLSDEENIWYRGRPVPLRPKFLPGDYVYWGGNLGYSGEVICVQSLNRDTLLDLEQASGPGEYFFFDVEDISTRWVYLIFSWSSDAKYWVDQDCLFSHADFEYYCDNPDELGYALERKKQMVLAPINQTLESVMKVLHRNADVSIFEPGDMVKWQIYSPHSQEYPVFLASGKVIKSVYLASPDQLAELTRDYSVLCHKKNDEIILPGWWCLLEFCDSLEEFSCWWPESELQIIDDRTVLPFYFVGYVDQNHSNPELLVRCTQSLLNTITPHDKPRFFNLQDKVIWHTHMAAGCDVDADYIHDGKGFIDDAMYVQSDFLSHQFLITEEGNGAGFVDWAQLYETWVNNNGVVGWVYRIVDDRLGHAVWTTTDGLRLLEHSFANSEEELYQFKAADGAISLLASNGKFPFLANEGTRILDSIAPCSFTEEMVLYPRRRIYYDTYIQWIRQSRLMCDPHSLMEMDDDSRD